MVAIWFIYNNFHLWRCGMSYSFTDHLKQNLYKNPSPVIKVRLDGTIDFFNRAFIKAAGLTGDQVKQLPGTSAVPVLGKLIWQCLEFVKKPEQQDGTLPKFFFPAEMTRAEKKQWSLAVAQSTEDNVLDGMICTLVAPEAEKQDGFKMLENILLGSPGAMVACTPEFELRGVNQKFVDLLGGKMDDYKGKSLAALVFDFEDFKRTFQQNEGKFAFSCVLQNIHKDAIYCVVSSNSLAPNMLSNSEHSGISKLYYIIQFLPLDEQQSQIVEVLNGKNLALAHRVSELQAENKHLLATSAPGATELLAQITSLQADLEKLRKEKEELEIQFRLLSSRYRTEKQECQREKEQIILDHQAILQEKQKVVEAKQALSEELLRAQAQLADLTAVLQKTQDENFTLNATNDRLQNAMDALREDHEAAKQALEAQHSGDLNKATLAYQVTLDGKAKEHENALQALRQECNEILADNEQAHQAVCVAYENNERELVDLRQQLAKSAMSGQLLAGAVKILETVSEIFIESLSDLPPDLKALPTVKNMLAASRDLEKLVSCLNLFDDAFLKTSPSRHVLLDICHSWQEEFTRQYPDRDLYFKYPVDGEITCYERHIRAIVRDLLANAVEATSDQSNGEVKVKIQIKAPPDIPKGCFKKEPVQPCLLVQVLDNGENWFDPEQAVKPYYTSKDGHLGLGLSNVRFLLEKMGGELELRSTPNGGVATFYVPLP